ncbi:efflux RND transporter permease subunit [Candidatus Methylospira mobilis]|uniref:Efflux pump membrane transporter n=1 Tax=Candidatus Methylospira mobilis TaxID=1808979 RepID=A0A5Q0BI13_9GAMM|nr:efflux RND transporter permease subunit [Candidatus Methylospira mobilis]QFY43470.1 efflux RND transporter permease subunit [Candidatus Methylospira mobilis]
MPRFFILHPTVSIVISIFMVLLGLIAMVQLPVAQYPSIAPPEVQLLANYVGADALAVEQAVATPIEQQMSGVDNMLYMTSINSGNGSIRLAVDFDVKTDPNTDMILMQIRYSQAEAQVPIDVRNYGVTIRKGTSSPLALFALFSPKSTYDPLFLASYAQINLYDPLARLPGIGQVNVFGSGQYAMRFWVRPDTLAKLNITVNDIITALQAQNTVNPSGQIGAEPAPPGQEFTYTVRSQGRLISSEQFENIIIRANPDGSIVRMRDVARAELGAQYYTQRGRMNGGNAAIIAIYQLPGSNAIETVNRAKALMEDLKTRFPEDIDYVVSLDTTKAVTQGIKEIVKTLYEAVILVACVVFVFLQGWRATLIPLLAVPVSLIGTFMFFPFFGFSINTLSLLGLVLAIGLVVDDAIVVVEAVERNIEHGMSPRAAALRAMEQVTGPIVATTLILGAVFIPAAFIPGITGRMYQQFAITISVSVFISGFNALSLSPALAALLLKPRDEPKSVIGRFFAAFNRWFERMTVRYIGACRFFIRKFAIALLLLGLLAASGSFLGGVLPASFIPEEDQGYFYINVQLPPAASIQRTDEVTRRVDEILKQTPGIERFNLTIGFSLLSTATTTYSAFYFVTLKPWDERDPQGLTAKKMMQDLNRRFAQMPEAQVFTFSPPAIPGVGTAGGITFVLEDKAGQDVGFLAENTRTFMEAARKRSEFSSVNTIFIPSVPQFFADVNRDQVLKQGIDLASVYKTLQVYMGGAFVNYFNRFGRTWQVYVQADGAFRGDTDEIAQFYVRNSEGKPVPMSALVEMKRSNGPEFTQRYNGYRSAQLNISLAPGYSSGQGMAALEQVFAETMPRGMGYDYMGMSFQEKLAAKGVSPSLVFAFSILMAFLILAAQYESWALPVSVMMGTPVAMFGAFAALGVMGLENDVFAQIGLVTLIGLAAKNAILIVEYARVEQKNGKSVVDAALTAAKVRLRPILMTAFTFLLGVLPLALASGAGAQQRQILGVTLIGGTLAASFIGILLIPASYYVVETWLVGSKARDRAPD